jgi:hypothetical protein
LSNLVVIFSHQHIFSGGYSHAATWEEETHAHDEPYGYEYGDDPFDPQGQADYPYMLLFWGIIGLIHFTHSHFKFDRRKIGEVLYHQRLTAFQIEDQIKALRK